MKSNTEYPNSLNADPAKLLKAAGILKTIKRQGWITSGGIASPESVADHSFRMAIIGAYLSETKDLDSSKVMRMCLIHDLAESEIGDMTPEEKVSEKKHRELEDKVARSIFALLPSKSRKVFLDDWIELLGKKGRESRLVWQIDKLEMGLTMKDYINAGRNPSRLKRFNPSRFLSKDLRAMFNKY